ncbi:multidrug resistance-associated protein 4-like [Sus scrofa]|uniref:multidrug resistance-associated protein 4-like n=1 Tax=Sus scrofa TaxID=9823 RepID=UPI000A2B0824|nr:multidrug resistance-associated protein 4-like [Sus scrofa]
MVGGFFSPWYTTDQQCCFSFLFGSCHSKAEISCVSRTAGIQRRTSFISDTESQVLVGGGEAGRRWLTPLLRRGYKRRLEEDDMYSVLPEDRSARLGEELQGYWDREVSSAEKDAREPSLMKAIIKCYWKSY